MDKATNELRMQKWASIVREANNSGLPKKTWCEQNGIKPRQFHYWQKKIRAHLLAAQNSSLPVAQNRALSVAAAGQDHSDTPVFCELKVPSYKYGCTDGSGSLSFSPEIMLQYNHFQMMIGSGISPETLTTVLDVIKNV